jgi:hypothetical protein
VWAHVLALALVLLALVPVIGTQASFSADEGAAIVQAQSLAGGDGWIVEHPLPEVDPSGHNYPLELSERGAKGFAPFAKHPLYALLLAGADWLGGVTAMILLSLMGTVAAAGLAGALARRLDPALVRPTVWVVGLASPLLFDGYIVIAHTLGAALAAAAALVAVVAIERKSWPIALAVVPCVVGAVLLRNEALFFAAALGLISAVVGFRRSRLTALVVSGGALFAGVAAFLTDRAWTRSIVGGTVPSPSAGSIGSGGSGFIAGRVKGFLTTWLTPSYGGAKALTVALVVMVVALAVGALVVRRRPADRGPIVLSSALAGLAAGAALVLEPTNLVPGLLIAFPLAIPGFVLLRRNSFGTSTARLLTGTFVLFAVAVIATQYSRGGTSEWGGRYFAIGVPLIVPVLLLALRDAGRRVDPVARRWALGSLVVCSVALASMGIGSVRHTHRFTGDLIASIERAGDGLETERPVMVTTTALIPRLSWRTFDRQRWLVTPASELADLTEALTETGVDRFVLVTNDLAHDRSVLPSSVEVVPADGAVDGSGWQVVVLRTAGA